MWVHCSQAQTYAWSRKDTRSLTRCFPLLVIKLKTLKHLSSKQRADKNQRKDNARSAMQWTVASLHKRAPLTESRFQNLLSSRVYWSRATYTSAPHRFHLPEPSVITSVLEHYHTYSCPSQIPASRTFCVNRSTVTCKYPPDRFQLPKSFVVICVPGHCHACVPLTDSSFQNRLSSCVWSTTTHVYPSQTQLPESSVVCAEAPPHTCAPHRFSFQNLLSCVPHHMHMCLPQIPTYGRLRIVFVMTRHLAQGLQEYSLLLKRAYSINKSEKSVCLKTKH